MHFRHSGNPYFRWGLTAVLSVCAIFAVYDIFFGAHRIAGYLGVAGAILTPMIYGCAIAYLLAPVVDFWEKTLLRRWAAPGTAARKQKAWVRMVSVILTFAVVLGLIALLLAFLIPEVGTSTMQLMDNIPVYIKTVRGWVAQMQGDNLIPDAVLDVMGRFYTMVSGYFSDTVSPAATGLLETISGSVVGLLRFFGNLLLGIIIGGYVMGMKEKLCAQVKKIICWLFDDDWTGKIMAAIHYMDDVFGGFIRGNILVSVVIGIICFVFFRLFQFPYAALLSVLIGVTNLVPFFGPFLGAIPAAILIFLVDPIKALEFIIFILVLQQIDGNFITPKILGQATGLESLWVIVSILVGGGLFGPIGMLLGCPIFAILYTGARLLVGKGLEKKHLPTETDAYRFTGVPEPHSPAVQPENTEKPN